MTDQESPHRFLHPRTWKAPRGYANGVLAEGQTIFLGGQVGWNSDQVFETEDFVGQIEQTLRNIVAVLAEAGARREHLVRLTWFVTDKSEYLERLPEIGKVYRSVLGTHFPAMSLVVVSALVEDSAKLEIEATAVIPYPKHR
jgi:enamine deaminase RidA (YjgF/YER057c/UK114 family)